MNKCDPITQAQCPHGAYCEPFAVYTDSSECAKLNKATIRLPKSNADRIRAMSDRELASFMAERTVKESCLRLNDEGYEPTATQIAALREKLFQTWIVWLQQHVEDAYEETST